MQWESLSYYQIERNLLTPEECQHIISLHTTAPFTHGVQGTSRDSDLFWIQSYQIQDMVTRIYDKAKQFYPHFDLVPYTDAVQLTKYKINQKYGWHMDFGAGLMSLRKISVSVELQNAEKGGGLEIWPMGPLHLRVGDAAFFPSFVMHCAKPVFQGERYSLVMWLTGETAFS